MTTSLCFVFACVALAVALGRAAPSPPPPPNFVNLDDDAKFVERRFAAAVVGIIGKVVFDYKDVGIIAGLELLCGNTCPKNENACLDHLESTHEDETNFTMITEMCDELPVDPVISLKYQCNKMVLQMKSSEDQDAICRCMFNAAAIYAYYRDNSEYLESEVEKSRKRRSIVKRKRTFSQIIFVDYLTVTIVLSLLLIILYLICCGGGGQR